MAYHQSDTYYNSPHTPYSQATQYSNQYPSSPSPGSANVYGNNEYDNQWDAKSAKSYQSSHHGSQAHLNAQAPPMPNVSYQQQYPPSPQQQHPGLYHAGSSAGWSVTKEKLMKRRSVKKVQLFQGNLVLDVDVPSSIVPAANQNVEEFSKLRYTAATCDPDDFMSSRYSLRQYLWGRQTELFIVMTMYNEDEVLFVKTMNAVIKNIAHLCSRTRSRTWGPEGWKKVVVCVVSDGRSKINKRTLQVLSLMGCYVEGIPKDTVGGKDVTAHIFEQVHH
jgi:chitin synthase